MWATAEDLTERAKAEIFLESGFPLQKTWVMQNLHIVLQSDSKGILQYVLVLLI
jgi:hypothetical protein